MDKLIEIKNITVKIQDEVILRNISLEVYKGDFIAIIGESGSGKSTLAKVVCGLIKPYSGDVVFNFDKRRIGMVFQDPFSSFNPVRKIIDSLYPFLYYRGIKSRQKIEEFLCKYFEKFNLDISFLYRYPFELSGGQLQRISILRATLIDPLVIVADEPTSALDASTKMEILNILSDINKNGISFLYITHDISTLKFFPFKKGKLIVILKGRVMEMGSMEESLKEPLHPYLELLLNYKNYPDVSEDIFVQGGCVFYSRCIYRQEKCKEREPLLFEVGERKVSCFLREKIDENQ